jgi:rod shape-determining protein MreD
MNPYWMFALLFTLTVLQGTVLPRIEILGVHPDLMLLAVTSWSLLRGSEEGMLWALIGGVGIDLLSGARFGIHTLPLLIVGFVAGLGQRRIFRLELLIPVLVIPLATLIYEATILAMLKLLGWPAAWGAGLSYVVLPSILVNTVSMPIVYLGLRMLHRRTFREGIAW